MVLKQILIQNRHDHLFVNITLDDLEAITCDLGLCV